jgi:hypothetical protein
MGEGSRLENAIIISFAGEMARDKVGLTVGSVS